MKENIHNIDLLNDIHLYKREIPVQRRSVAGRFSSHKNGRIVNYESTLEKDYFYALEFDDNVHSYTEQPFAIEGKYKQYKVNYVPDVLVVFKDSPILMLVEVKYASDLEEPEKKEKIENKGKVIDAWVSKNDMTYKLVTENDIRDVPLSNNKLLYGYLTSRKHTREHISSIISLMSKTNGMRVIDIMREYSSKEIEQAWLLPSIWYMLAHQLLSYDKNELLTSYSFVEVVHGNH